jgi:hypothetical protein
MKARGNPSGPEATKASHQQAGYMEAAALTDRCHQRVRCLQIGGVHIWVDYARTKTPAENCDIYGAGWWVTPATGQGKPLRALTPNGPRDLFAAEGQEGQVIVLVPSKDLIVVRLGHLDDRIGWRPLGDWLEHLVGLFPDASQ